MEGVMSKHYSNEYLFSEIYLNEITQLEEEPDVVANLETIKDYREYADTSDIASWNNSYIHEILQSLGFQLEHKNDNLILLKPFGESNNILTICYSIMPEENLDKTKMGEHWAEKIIRNLRDNDLHWGILTNGKKWRIYHTEESVPYDNFLEIDLEEIINEEDTSSYQIFHHFMQAENFKNDEDDKCKFDIFKKESQEKIEYIEDELKDALKQKEEKEGAKGILSSLCMGYKDFLQKNGDPDFNNEELRDTIYGSAMLYMFRLLFLFYGKARGLLKQEDQQRFEKVLSYAIDNKDSKTLEEDTYNIWRELSYIFGEIDIYYDGGLFNPRENKLTAFIEEHKISDYYLIDVLYYLYYYEKDGEMIPISYRDMDVRHLGTLYEGLLEHKLYIAEEDTEIKMTSRKIEFIPRSEGGKIVKGSYIPEGKVYFAGDKKERKKIGAYYTPESIVEYIVTHTVGEKVDELIDQFKEDISSTIESLNSSISKDEKDNYKDYIHDQIIQFINEEILELSVLDPAMGSGHFLVNATNLITNKIVEFLNDFGLNLDIDTSPQYWRRKVVESCIYGVDKNELAVNLAKLSLWILSMAKDKPLSFLDHHLKQGDSLVGANLENVGQFPRDKRIKGVNLFEDNLSFDKDVKNIIDQYNDIENIESEERDIIDSKKEILEEITEKTKPYKFICDFHTQATYDKSITQQEYENTVSSFNTNFVYERPNNYFHWELEYPEVLIKNGGFDCIIGNPPYGNLLSDFQKQFVSKYYDGYKSEIAAIFTERQIKLTNISGYYGNLITLAITYGLNFSNTRQKLVDNFETCKVASFDRDPVGIFDDMSQSVSIVIGSNKDKNSQGKILTSCFYRVTKTINSNLSTFIKQIKLSPANNYVQYKSNIGSYINKRHRLPKIGNSINKNILSKLKNNPSNIENLLTADNGKDFYIRTSGNYWYNAFDRKPYSSTEMKLFKAINESAANFIIIVVNSSLFYLYGRIYGDGRHMSSSLIKAFPVPEVNKIELYDNILFEMKENLMNSLFNNFKNSQNRFITSNCKKTIDECDQLLGEIYNIDDTIIEYIQNVDKCIRNTKTK